MDDFEIDIFLDRVIQRYEVDELCEHLNIRTVDIVERFRDELLEQGYSIFDD